MVFFTHLTWLMFLHYWGNMNLKFSLNTVYCFTSKHTKQLKHVQIITWLQLTLQSDSTLSYVLFVLQSVREKFSCSILVILLTVLNSSTELKCKTLLNYSTKPSHRVCKSALFIHETINCRGNGNSATISTPTTAIPYYNIIDNGISNMEWKIFWIVRFLLHDTMLARYMLSFCVLVCPCFCHNPVLCRND